MDERIARGGRVQEVLVQVPDLPPHHSQAHLAVAAGARVGPLQLGAGVPDIDDVGLEHEPSVHALLVVRRHLVDLAVVQLQRHDAAVGRAVEDPPVRQDRGRARARVQLVDLHAADLVRPVVHLLHEDVVALEPVDEHPLADLRGRPFPAHVHHEVGQGVVGLGEHVVVEEHQPQAIVCLGIVWSDPQRLAFLLGSRLRFAVDP